MNKSIIINISAFLAVVFFTSCTDVVPVKVSDGGSRLVIEADILWEKGTTGHMQSIDLSSSTPYFSEDEHIPVTGAIVTVTKDDDGAVFNFIDQNNGEYTTNHFIPEINQSYTLGIAWGGKTYTAQEVLKAVPYINEVRQIDGDVSGEEEETIVNLYFNDPADIRNYYLAFFSASHQAIQSLDVFNDEFSDGRENFAEFEGENIDSGLVINYTLHGISEGYFHYVEIFTEQSGSDEGPFQSTPVKLKGNCKNINDETEEVLGFFRLNEMVKGQYVIQ